MVGRWGAAPGVHLSIVGTLNNSQHSVPTDPCAFGGEDTGTQSLLPFLPALPVPLPPERFSIRDSNGAESPALPSGPRTSGVLRWHSGFLSPSCPNMQGMIDVHFEGG